MVLVFFTTFDSFGVSLLISRIVNTGKSRTLLGICQYFVNNFVSNNRACSKWSVFEIYRDPPPRETLTLLPKQYKSGIIPLFDGKTLTANLNF